MNILIKYFGQVAEHIQKEEEKLALDVPISIDELDKLIQEKYQLHVEYTIAINHEVKSTQHQLIEGDEIAFLPAFAGG